MEKPTQAALRKAARELSRAELEGYYMAYVRLAGRVADAQDILLAAQAETEELVISPEEKAIAFPGPP